MNHFHLGGVHGEEFDEREQAEIIAVAAALQREHGQRATLSDLERAAIEAGIEPRFVREAVARRGRVAYQPTVVAESVESTGSAWQAILVAALFVPAELEAFRNLTIYYHRTPAMLIAVFAAVLLGLFLPRQAWARRVAGVWPLAVMFMLTLDMRGWHPAWHLLLLIWLAAMQGAIAVGVHIVRSRKAEGQRVVGP